MSVEQINAIVLKKFSNEVRPIIPGEAKEHFDSLFASYLSTSDDENPYWKMRFAALLTDIPWKLLQAML